MTTTATHTPGPWTYRPCTIGHPNNRRNPIVSSEGNYIARVCSQESTLPGMTSRAPDAATAEANARLIAAAPALLAACRAALTALQLADQDVYDEGKTCAQLTAAIEQATSAKIHGAITEGRG